MRGSLAPKLAILVSASLLALGHSHVLAQPDEIPDTVLVTGSLLAFHPVAREHPPSPMNEQLTQLTDDELKAILPGATIRPVSRFYLISLLIKCSGSFEFLNAPPVSVPYPPPPSPVPIYWIADNQVCMSWGQCFKVFRSEVGNLFSDVYENGRAGLRLVEIVPPPPEQACMRR